MKYRVKLNNGRIIGPFEVVQIAELFEKSHLSGTEEIQEFPTGDWKPIKSFQSTINLNKPQAVNPDATFMRKISDFNLEQPKAIPETPIENPLSIEPEVKPTAVVPENYPGEFQFDKKEPTELKLDDLKIEKPKNQNLKSEPKIDVEKTVVASKKALMEVREDIDKTKVNIQRQKMKVAEEVEPVINEQVIQEDIPNNQNIQQDATQFINYEKAKDKFLKEIETVEKEIEVKEKKVLFDQIQVEKPVKKKKKLWLIAGALLAVVLLLEDEPKKQNELPISYPQIHYPIKFDLADKEKAKNLYLKGLDIYNLGSYKEKIRAAIYFKDSVENDFDSNQAMGMLLSCYSEILEASKNLQQDANLIYKLINVVSPRLTEDPNIAYGIAKFYNTIKKYNASIETISRYLVIAKPSLKVFAVYLNSLYQSGDLQNAKKVYDLIKSQPNKPREAYIETINFDLFNQNFNEAEISLNEGLSVYPQSVELLLLKANLDIHHIRFNDLSNTLEKINKLKADFHPHYYAKLLEYTGMYLAKSGKNKEAYQMFTQALKIHESAELRSKLSSLKIEAGQNPEISTLVSQSQTINLMNKAKIEIKNNSYEKALALLINAVDMTSDYAPAKILLSEVQIELGYYKQAISTLIDLVKKDSMDPDANFSLLEAYVKAYKFADAKRHIGNISNTTLRESPRFTRAVGEMYYQMNDYLQAISWMSKAVDADPLDDRPYEVLAKIYLMKKDFKRAKILLSKAIELEPKKPVYRVAYARIIYEMEDADTALGYLRGISHEFSLEPEVQGEIAILYYRSG